MPPAAPRVLFYVQHLLGIGHLVRGLRIARALLAHGFAVDLVLGGDVPEGVALDGARVTQLHPLKAAAGFSHLATLDGQPATAAIKDARTRALLAAFDAARPDVLLIEAYPFARRQLDFELLPLLEEASARRPKPLVAISVRDILQRKSRPERARQAVAIIRRHVDAVLVHGDPTFSTLADTFPLAAEIADRVHDTGIVGPGPLPPPAEAFDVIVSAGGGAVGERLLRTAMDARETTVLRQARWLFVHGPNHARRDWARTDGVRHVGFMRDLPQALGGARLSVSQAGYNTVADLLQARCAAVLVPFAEGGETEQTERAARLAARGRAVHLPEDRLDPATLAAAIDAACALPPGPSPIDLDGAAATANLLKKLLGRPMGAADART